MNAEQVIAAALDRAVHDPTLGGPFDTAEGQAKIAVRALREAGYIVTAPAAP